MSHRTASTVAVFLLLGLACFQVVGQTPGSTCSNPAIRCDSTYSFASYQLPFVIKGELVFGKTYKSVAFYAVILKSVKAGSDAECAFVTEHERVAAQSEFGESKVFASRHSCPEELLLYQGVAQNINFLAVYAGTTPATAARTLSRVKATGRYPQAYIKKMRVVLEYST